MATKKTTGTSKKVAKKKPVTRKKAAPASRKRKTTARKPVKKTAKPRILNELKKTGLGIAILLAVCLTTAMLADIFIKSGRPVPTLISEIPDDQETTAIEKTAKKKYAVEREGASTPRTKAKAAGLKEKRKTAGKSSSVSSAVPDEGTTIVYEVFDDVDPVHPKPKVSTGTGDHTPQIAIIIDDIGYDKRLAMALVDLDREITFSILPFSPFGKTIAKRLKAKGAEVMLHLPMEPTQYPKVNPGPGALFASMSPDEMIAQLRKDLDAVPGVVGVNNHMGSRLTALPDKMNQIFTVLKKEDLFFIDSRTAPDSKGEASARLFMVKFSHRDVFLDNFQNVEYITGQFRKLIKRAKKHGTAIGIGHPYQATLDTLKKELPKMNGTIKLVPASQLVAIPG
ncbi:MAG: divergent polysaccharide deacetylase family protein [Desulfobacterales bacterium]|nr:divergent polysaccharide deacetylase family protein [Desulfobacterales bacterium]